MLATVCFWFLSRCYFKQASLQATNGNLQQEREKSTMSFSERHLSRPRQLVLPPLSSRTLHHPSFLPLYMAADFGPHHWGCSSQTVHPIIPAEFFYTDPTEGPGRRIPNTVTDLGVLDCFQLNTPPPVMSTSVAPLNLIRFGPHPTRDLGSTTWRMLTNHHGEHPSRVVLQLTQEEDQAITNLLKLHHQSPLLSAERLIGAQIDLSRAKGPPQGSACLTPVYNTLCSDVQQRGGWSDIELEAANTLLSGFMDENLWGQNDHKSVESCHDRLPYQRRGDLSLGTETQHGSEALPAVVTTQSTHNDKVFSCVGENEEPGWQDVMSAEDGLVRGRTSSDLEGDAARVLLSLGHIRTVDIVQGSC